jgi:16S rRNA (cytosine1402-N4)-methyltransferase
VSHVSVLLDETVDAVVADPKGCYVDGTAGGGGHSARLLAKNPEARLLALDRDALAVDRVRERLREFGDRAHVAHATFDSWRAEARRLGWMQVNGILLDLGFSSFQMDDPQRGFSFMRNGPLDMRMDTTQGQTAADLVNNLDESQLSALFYRYGEEPDARRIAKEIVAKRPLSTTHELAGLVYNAVPARRRREKIHPATQVFQALRIEVNNELSILENFLANLPEGLAPHGRVAIISFHSLEDRLVKRRFRELSKGCVCPPAMPVCGCGMKPVMRDISKKSIKPSESEIAANPRSRSARLRVAELVAA